MKVSTQNEGLIIADEIQSPPSLSFMDGDKEVGKLTWDDGEFKFEGNAHESAERFIKWLKELWKTTQNPKQI